MQHVFAYMHAGYVYHTGKKAEKLHGTNHLSTNNISAFHKINF